MFRLALCSEKYIHKLMSASSEPELVFGDVADYE